jgi:dehydrogenase/reductase SDR family member 7
MVSIMIISGIVAILAVGFMWADCDVALQFLPYSSLDKSFANQTIWITGASSGIGAVLAEELTAGGAQVIISARRVNQLEGVAEKCAAVGLRPMILPFDALDFDEHYRAFQEIVEKFGGVDVLVLNPGRSQRALAMDTQLADTRQLFELNFFSYVNLAKIVVPTMTSRKSGGQVVVVSSISGKLGTPLASSYSGTKYALHGYFDALRSEVSSKNVNVQIVCPGPVESEISEHSFKSELTKQSPKEVKMPTARCTHLMAKGLKWKLDEIWITNQPVLIIAYMAEYLPFVSRQLMKRVIGPGRVKALETGGNIYDLKTILGIKSK